MEHTKKLPIHYPGQKVSIPNPHKHTPTPWSVEAYETKRGLTEPDLYEVWGDSHKIADVPKWPCDNSAAHDAAFIVRACNLYDELVEALTLVAELSDRNDYETYFDSIHKIVRPVLARAREGMRR